VTNRELGQLLATDDDRHTDSAVERMDQLFRGEFAGVAKHLKNGRQRPEFSIYHSMAIIG
jgi:hypothetical protein